MLVFHAKTTEQIYEHRLLPQKGDFGLLITDGYFAGKTRNAHRTGTAGTKAGSLQAGHSFGTLETALRCLLSGHGTQSIQLGLVRNEISKIFLPENVF